MEICSVCGRDTDGLKPLRYFVPGGKPSQAVVSAQLPWVFAACPGCAFDLEGRYRKAFEELGGEPYPEGSKENFVRRTERD